MSNSDGYTILAGTLVGLRSAGDDVHVFRVRTSVIVEAGSTETLPAEVTLEAIDPGTEPNGIRGGIAVELIDTLDFVGAIVTTEVVAGGVSAETDREYLNRLADQFALFSPRAIVPTDFEALARSIAGVSRAIAIDGYNSDDQSFNNEKTILVSVIDDMGANVSASTLASTKTLLEREREVNFIINVENPTRTMVNVNVVGVAYPEWVIDDVVANVRDSVSDFLSPSRWGLPRFGDQLLWKDERAVRYLDLVTAVGNTEGLNYPTTVQLAIDDRALAQVDLDLPGIPVLPMQNNVTVVITHA